MSQRNLAYTHRFVALLVSLLPAPLQRAIERHGDRLFRFGVVGVSGVAVDMVLLYMLVAHCGMYKLAAAAIAAEVSILSNFALNDRWTFHDRREGSWVTRALQYNACTFAGEVVSLSVLSLLTTTFGMHYMVANFFAMGGAAVGNYMLNTRFTWAAPARRGLAPVRVAASPDW